MMDAAEGIPFSQPISSLFSNKIRILNLMSTLLICGTLVAHLFIIASIFAVSRMMAMLTRPLGIGSRGRFLYVTAARRD